MITKKSKSTLWLIALSVILLIALSITAVASGTVREWFKRPVQTDAYTFPAYDGDGPLYWEDAVTFYQIPNNRLSAMTTDGLIETCLNYPLFAAGMITSNVSMYSGFLDTRNNFNGLAELFKRDDAAKKLTELYTTSKLSDVISSDEDALLRMKYLEYMLAQDEILLSLTKSERLTLLKSSIGHFEAVRDEYEGFFPPDSTILIVSKILAEDNAKFKELMEEHPGIASFNHDGVCDEITLESVDTIVDFINEEALLKRR